MELAASSADEEDANLPQARRDDQSVVKISDKQPEPPRAPLTMATICNTFSFCHCHHRTLRWHLFLASLWQPLPQRYSYGSPKPLSFVFRPVAVTITQISVDRQQHIFTLSCLILILTSFTRNKRRRMKKSLIMNGGMSGALGLWWRSTMEGSPEARGLRLDAILKNSKHCYEPKEI